MHIIVFITAPTQSKAKEIAKFLVVKKLVACVNIVPKVDSLFWWKGKIDNAREVLLVAKTKKSLFKKVIAAVKSKHPYEVPEIIGVPIVCGNKDYLIWIDDSIKKRKR